MIYFVIFNALIVLRLALMRMASARRHIYYLVLVALFLFSAFRFEVGCDWSGYLNQYFIFTSYYFSDIWSERQPLWIGLFVLQSWAELPYPWINIPCSLMFFLGVHALARRQPDRLAFLVLLFPVLIINMPMSIIRQGAAIGIMCFAFIAFTERRLLRFVVLTVIAAGFHSSAIVFLLLAPLATGAYSKTRLALSALLAIPGAFALMSTDAADVATSRYLDSGVEAAGAAFRVTLLSLTGFAFFFILRNKWADSFRYDYKIVMVGSLIMMAMSVFVPVSSVIADRLGYYLVPIQTMIFARLPYLELGRHRRVLIIIPYAILLVLFAVWTSLSRHFQICYLPYQTWMFGFPDEMKFPF